MRDSQYKYKNDKDIIRDCIKSINDYFDVVFESFEKDIKTFILQVVNLILVFVFLNFFISPFINSLLVNIKGSGIISYKILLLLICTIFIQTLLKNSVIKWQTLFKMDYKMTKIYFLRLALLNLTFYGGRELYRNRSHK